RADALARAPRTCCLRSVIEHPRSLSHRRVMLWTKGTLSTCNTQANHRVSPLPTHRHRTRRFPAGVPGRGTVVQSIEEVRRRSSVTRVPPHNLEAEESLLGAMLLSRDAITAALEC